MEHSLYDRVSTMTRGDDSDDHYGLVIPNRSVESVITDQIQEWFKEKVHKKIRSKASLFEALKNGDSVGIEDALNDILMDMISSRDYSGNQGKKENFYHGFLLGMFMEENWEIVSNVESGYSFLDIAVIYGDESAFYYRA
jgi:hypothetical protein